MCRFIILLLLLCKNGGNCCYNMNECACVENTCSNTGNSRRWDSEDWRRDREEDCRRNERDCGCSACEEAVSDTSPIKEREDIWTSYKNTSSGRPCK